MANLVDIEGIGVVYAEKLGAQGVNSAKSLVRQLPTQKQVEDWIAGAKALDRVVTY